MLGSRLVNDLQAAVAPIDQTGAVEDDGTSERLRLAAGIAGSLAGASVGALLSGNAGALVGAVIGPTATVAVDRIVGQLRRERGLRASFTLQVAADKLGTTTDELLRQLTSNPAREELLTRSLRAAQDAGLVGKLVLLGHAMARGADSDAASVFGETAFVRALDDCDIAHISVLAGFTQSPNELGLGNGDAEFNTPGSGDLNTAQLSLAFPQFEEHLDHLLATLQRHGLVASRTAATGFLGMVTDGSIEGWRITRLGRDFLTRIAALSELGVDEPEG